MKGSLTLVLLVLLTTAVSAQVPETMSYQGTISNSDGSAVSDGVYSLTFRLYDVAGGG